MSRKANQAIPLLTEVKALQLAQEMDPDKAHWVEFLIMELGSDARELSTLFRRMRQPLSYEAVIDLLVELKIRCAIVSDRSAQLAQVLDELVGRAPDLPEE
jgi:hypothetical protein